MVMSLFIPGPAGNIEALFEQAKTDEIPWLGIVCHPHSLHGGTMDNKVVYTVAKLLQTLGMPTIRFNFRGVGQSEGEYDHGMGETDDLLSVLAWAKQQHKEANICLTGFSFGSFVSYRASTRYPIQQLITIAPPVVNFNFPESPEPDCPWIIVVAGKDEVVSPTAVEAWISSLTKPAHILRFPEASHFFHGQLIELRNELQHALSF